MAVRPYNKYGVAKYADRCYNGTAYASKDEANYARELDALKSAKARSEKVTAWRTQIRTPLKVNGQTITTYVIDFEAIYADGRIEFIEVKGFPTTDWKIKFKLFKAIYPEKPIRVVTSNQKLVKWMRKFK